MKLTPAASTRTSTWPGPGLGVGRSASCITSGPPCFSTRMAFMAALFGGRRPGRQAEESLSAGPIPRYSAHPPPPRKDITKMAAQKHPDRFVHRHIGPDASDVAKMIEVLGLPSLDALIDRTVPGSTRLQIGRAQ